MFLSREDAEGAVRTKNAIIDEPNDYVGIVEMTEDMVSDERLRTFGKNTELFDELFKGAKIPKARGEKKQEDTTRKDAKIDGNNVQDVASLLGMGDGSSDKAKEEAAKEEAAKEEAAKEEAAKEAAAKEEAAKEAAAKEAAAKNGEKPVQVFNPKK